MFIVIIDIDRISCIYNYLNPETWGWSVICDSDNMDCTFMIRKLKVSLRNISDVNDMVSLLQFCFFFFFFYQIWSNKGDQLSLVQRINLSILFRLDRKLNWIYRHVLEAAGYWRFVVLRVGGNKRTRRKTTTLDGRPLPWHIPTSGIEHGPLRRPLPWQIPTSSIEQEYPFAIQDVFGTGKSQNIRM